MNDWVVETPTFEEDLMNNRVVMLNQVGVNRVVEIIKEKDKEIERLNKELESLEKLNNANYQSFIEVNTIINTLEKEIQKEIERTEKLIQDDYKYGLGHFGNIRKMLNEERKNWLYKIKELKGSDKE